MNWKTDLQLRDLEPDQVMEFTCTTCGHVHHCDALVKQVHPELLFAWLDEIERDEVCKKMGCLGRVRLAIYHRSETSGFIGGLA
jgi:hypothetical protein